MTLLIETDQTIRTLKVYDLLSTLYTNRSWLREFVSSQAALDSFITHEESDEVVGVAIPWQVSDPYDIVDAKGYCGEDPNGKYLFFPTIFVHPMFREDTGRVLKMLLFKAFRNHPAAKKAVFQRFKPRDSQRLHILKMRD